MDDQLLVNLSKAEKRALRILAAIEGQSMNEFTRESIRAKWSVYFPDYPLGAKPTGKHGKETDKDGGE